MGLKSSRVTSKSGPGGWSTTSAPLRISLPTTKVPGSLSPATVHGTRSGGTLRILRTCASVKPAGATTSWLFPCTTMVRYETDVEVAAMLPLGRKLRVYVLVHNSALRGSALGGVLPVNLQKTSLTGAVSVNKGVDSEESEDEHARANPFCSV